MKMFECDECGARGELDEIYIISGWKCECYMDAFSPSDSRCCSKEICKECYNKHFPKNTIIKKKTK